MGTARDFSRLCMFDMPPVFHEEVLPKFVGQYDDFMLETFGPNYERPDFKSVLPKRKARKTRVATPEKSDYFQSYEQFQPNAEEYVVGATAPTPTQFEPNVERFFENAGPSNINVEV